MDYSQIKIRIANPGERAFYARTFAISNEFGIIAFVYAGGPREALDIAADSGHLDSEKMSDDDHQEYSSNQWDDSFLLLGNASEPFWSEYMGIMELERTNGT